MYPPIPGVALGAPAGKVLCPTRSTMEHFMAGIQTPHVQYKTKLYFLASM